MAPPFDSFHVEVCIHSLFLKQDTTRLEGTSRIAETVTKLLMSGLAAQEKFRKILVGMGLISTTREILEWS